MPLTSSGLPDLLSTTSLGNVPVETSVFRLLAFRAGDLLSYEALAEPVVHNAVAPYAVHSPISDCRRGLRITRIVANRIELSV